MTLADLAACFDEPEEKLVEMLAVLYARGKLVEIAPSRYLTSSTLDRLWTDCETMLTKYHREHPLHAGMRLAEARQRLLRGKTRENSDAILACFAREGKLTLTAEHCALADFSVHLTKRQSAIREELLRTCRAAGILGKKQDTLCALFDKKTAWSVRACLRVLYLPASLCCLRRSSASKKRSGCGRRKGEGMVCNARHAHAGRIPRRARHLARPRAAGAGVLRPARDSSPRGRCPQAGRAVWRDRKMRRLLSPLTWE